MGDHEGEATVQQDEVDGVHAADSVYRDLDRVQLAPPDDYRIQTTDQLVIVAADGFAAAAGTRGVVASRAEGAADAASAAQPLPEEPAARRSVAATRIQTSSRGKLARERTKELRKEVAALASRAASATCAALSSSISSKPTKSPSTNNEKAGRAVGPQSSSASTPKVVLLIGWSQSLGQLLRAFDARLPEGSTMYILADREMSARKSDMEADGIALDGSAASKESAEFESEVTDGPACMATDGMASGVTSCGLRHLRIRHVVGFVTDYLALRRLPVRRADIAVIVVQSKVVTPPRVAAPVGTTMSHNGSLARSLSLSLALSRSLSLSLALPHSPSLSLSLSLSLTHSLLSAQPPLSVACVRHVWRRTWTPSAQESTGWRALSWQTRRR